MRRLLDGRHKQTCPQRLFPDLRGFVHDLKIVGCIEKVERSEVTSMRGLDLWPPFDAAS